MTEPAEFEETACDLCGGVTEEPFCEKFGQTIVRCLTCGLVFVNPRLTARETARRYSDSYFWSEYLPVVSPPSGTADVSRFLRYQYGPAFELLPAARPDAPLLEIGTGAGFMLKAAGLYGWKACGIEYSAAAAAYASHTLNLRVVRADAGHLPFGSNVFGAVLMFDVIEHLHHPRQTLAEVRRCLKSDGVLVIATPNLNALSHKLLGDAWAVLSPAEHLYYFTEETLRRLLSNAGYGSVRFVRRYRRWKAPETMNARYTHAPGTARARAYAALVHTVGRVIYRGVQSLGRADALLAIASVR